MSPKKNIFLFIFILLSSTIFSQISIDIIDSLQWSPLEYYTIKNGNNIEKFYYLHFNKSIYQDAFMVPHYTKVIDIPYFGDAKVNIEILNSNVLTTEDEFLGKDRLRQDFVISTKIYSAQKKARLIVDFIPIKKENDKIILVQKFKIKITLVPQSKPKYSYKYKNSSILSSGKWVKIGIPETGIYKISFDKLRELGFSQPERVRVFGNDFGQLPYYNNQDAPDDLIENTVMYGADYILFFANGVNKWYYDSTRDMFLTIRHDYSDTAYYFLSDINTNFDNDIQISNEPQNFNQVIDYYTWYTYYGKDYYNFLKSGRLWFDKIYFYNNTTRRYTFSPSQVIAEPAKAFISIMGRAYTNNYVTVSYNEQSATYSIPPISGIHGTDYGKIINVIFNFTPTANDDIKLSLKYTNGLRAFLDYIVINAQRKIVYDDSTTIVQCPQSVGTGKITKFIIHNAKNDLMVWDITDPTKPKSMPYQYDNGQGLFIASTDSLRQFVIFSLEDVKEPIFTGKFLGSIANQNLHAIPASTQMIIISYPDFIEAAEKIATFHRQYDNMEVKVVTTQQVYNEYSSGIRDGVAIRNFLRSIYLKNNSQLEYVLLLGDGSFKNKYDINNTNFIPTYQTLNSLNTNGLLTITSDDFFVLLDDNEGETTGFIDANIGRIPAKTPEEALIAADKIEQYILYSKKSFWKSNITLIADDGEQNLFMDQLEQVTDNIYNNFPQFTIKKIYIDAYPAQVSFAGEEYPEAVTDIKNMVEKGTLILAYNGHGNESVLTSERVLTVSDVRNWQNIDNLAFMITATCLFGHFDDYNYSKKEQKTSGVEYALFNPNGGIFSSFTTPRESYTTTNYYMLNYLFSNILQVNNHQNITIGEAITNTKLSYPSYYNKEFLLIGDPALSLNFPAYQISDIQLSMDTIKALSRVEVQGHITDTNGNLVPYNGRLFVKIFDKYHIYKTLNNDGFGEFNYKDFKTVIYSGEVSIKNGYFKFNFLTPMDIDKTVGQGKMIYYSTDGQREYMGYKELTIGGVNDTIINDTQGPEIRIFLNDTTVSGNTITDRNPKVIVLLKDPNGINTASFGLGHNIQLVLDDKQFFNLNKYFSYKRDNSQEGKIEYQLYKLSPGEHTLTIKAFDALNNYSEKSIKFTVMDQRNFIINRIFNYPNPFTTTTQFFFEHNQPGKEMQVILQIFSISGRLVKTINRQMINTTYISEPLIWDGKDDYGNNIGKGVYVYVLTVRLSSGESVKKIGKILKI